MPSTESSSRRSWQHRASEGGSAHIEGTLGGWREPTGRERDCCRRLGATKRTQAWQHAGEKASRRPSSSSHTATSIIYLIAERTACMERETVVYNSVGVACCFVCCCWLPRFGVAWSACKYNWPHWCTSPVKERKLWYLPTLVHNNCHCGHDCLIAHSVAVLGGKFLMRHSTLGSVQQAAPAKPSRNGCFNVVQLVQCSLVLHIPNNVLLQCLKKNPFFFVCAQI